MIRWEKGRELWKEISWLVPYSSVPAKKQETEAG